MSEEKQLNAIRLFCKKPYSQHGKQRTSNDGRFDHDWAYLADQIHHSIYGRALRNEVVLKAVGKRIRGEYPNGPNWNTSVNAPGAHGKILSIIRDGLAEELEIINPPTK